MNPAIACTDLTKAYGDKVAIAGVDLVIPRGSIFGFLGPNGAGKTTTIRVLLGLLRADSGSARVLDRDAWHESTAIRSGIGYVPGDLRLWPWLRGRTAWSLLSAIHGRDLASAGRDVAERLGLDPGVPVRAMSRGMRQKLGLLMALAPNPELLVLDEPTTALDPVTQAELFAILRERAANGTTVFFSSHVLGEVETLCDAVAFVRRGEIVVNETLDELRRQAARIVHVEFATAIDADDVTAWGALGFDCTEHSAGGRTVRGQLRGPVDPFLRELGQRTVTDLEFGAPDLEHLFFDYYTHDGEGSA